MRYADCSSGSSYSRRSRRARWQLPRLLTSLAAARRRARPEQARPSSADDAVAHRHASARPSPFFFRDVSGQSRSCRAGDGECRISEHLGLSGWTSSPRAAVLLNTSAPLPRMLSRGPQAPTAVRSRKTAACVTSPLPPSELVSSTPYSLYQPQLWPLPAMDTSTRAPAPHKPQRTHILSRT